MNNEFCIMFDDARFAYLIQEILERAGLKCVGGVMITEDEVWKRQLWFKRFDIPERADFVPTPIAVNLPFAENAGELS